MIEVHLTSDALHVDLDGHRLHWVARWIYGLASPGVAAPIEVVCSCDVRFKLKSGPKAK